MNVLYRSVLFLTKSDPITSNRRSTEVIQSFHGLLGIKDAKRLHAHDTHCLKLRQVELLSMYFNIQIINLSLE